jgi:very-short-patch-repair endonuclease
MAERWEKTLFATLYSQAAVRLETQFSYYRGRIAQDCESPIERLFAAAWMQFEPWLARRAMVLADPCEMEHLETRIAWLVETYRPDPRRRLPLFMLFPQMGVSGYRADFLAVGARRALASAPYRAVVVVECDGFDFHERTKEQAECDRRRDRELQAAGYPVLRFTGSELHRDPFEAVVAVRDFLAARLSPVDGTEAA